VTTLPQPDLSPAERHAIAAIDEEGLVRLLEELIAIPSVANQETPAQRRMADAMEAAGLETDRWEIDFARLKTHPAYASDIERSEGLGLVGTLRGSGTGRTLVLNGHVDVVEAGDVDRWSSPPFQLTRRAGRLYGRGTVDMKGALCCALFAAKAIRDAGVALAGTVQIQSVIGEEDGGAGTLATIERGHGGDGAIVLEPTQMVLAPAQAGALSFQIEVPGRAAHGAFREEGIDPIESFLPIFHALRALEGKRNAAVEEPLFKADALPFALTMGRLRAGIWPSTVAESLRVEGRYGVAPGEDVDEAVAALEAAVAKAAADDTWLAQHPPVVTWDGAQFAAASTPVDDPIVTTVAEAARAVLGVRPVMAGVRFGADMQLLVNQAGIPTVLYGPGDVRDAHRPDENVALEDLLTTARVLVVAAMRFCGVAG
jgi:acetylornithine deacetylase